MKKAAEYFQLQVYFEDKNAIDSKPAHIFVLGNINTTTTTTTNNNNRNNINTNRAS